MTTPIADKGIQEGKPMWPSLQTADWLFSLSNVALIVGLALTVVATVGAVWMANVREGYLKRELSDANTLIGETRKEAAKANERAAGLEVEAENARLAQEKLKAQLAWRLLSDDQTNKLLDALAQSPGLTINIEFVANDQEAQYLAAQFSTVFESSKWVVRMSSATALEAVIFGVLIPDGQELNQQTVDVVKRAFEMAGVKYALTGLTMGEGAEPEISDRHAATLLVGSREPAR